MGSNFFSTKKSTGFFIVAIIIFVNFLTVKAQSPISNYANLKKVAGGFQFTEGPCWTHNALLFSDIPANTIYQWKPEDGVSVFVKPSGHSNGIAVMPDGTIVIAQHSRAISRITKNKKIETITDQYHGKKLNSPNDLVVAGDGSIYFSDPPFGIKPDQKEQSVNGVYRISKNEDIQLLISDIPSPNGLAFSPDGKRLYINDSSTNHVLVYKVDTDGSLHDGQIFAKMEDMTAKFGTADGLKVDSKGNVFSTGPGGIWIFSPEGTLLDRISTPEYASNLAFGGKKMKTLFITTTHNVFRIPVKYKGKR